MLGVVQELAKKPGTEATGNYNRHLKRVLGHRESGHYKLTVPGAIKKGGWED